MAPHLSRGAAPLYGLLILTGLLYAPSLSHGYIYEDSRPEIIQWPLRVPSRDLAELTHAVIGLRPGVDHGLSVGLHLLNGWLLAVAVSRIAGSLVALLAATVFLVHPLAAAAVLTLSARTDVLLTTGALIAVAATTWPTMTPARGWATTAGLAVAATSKEVGVVALAIVALSSRWTRWPSWRQVAASWSWTALAALGAAAAGLVIGRLWTFLPNWWAMAPEAGGAAIGRIAYITEHVSMVAHLLALVVWPVGFSFDHDPLAVSRVAGVLLLSAWTLILIVAWRRCPVIAWALAWIGLTLAPRALFPTSEALTEPHLYLPFVGVSVLAGWLLAAPWTGPQERIA